MEKAKLISYGGKNIYFMDFSNMKSKDEIIALIAKSSSYIRSSAPNSVLTLTNISKMHFSSEIKELFTSFVSGNKPYVKAGSVVGISGIQSILYNAIMRITGTNLKSMKSIDDAKEWLKNNSN